MPEAYLGTFAVVFLVELTDRTRILALLLSARYRSPWQLIIGMTLGYIPATAVAVWGAGFLAHGVPQTLLKWLMVTTFLVFGAYLAGSRGDEDGKHPEEKWLEKIKHLSPFLIGLILVAVTEFADKSQIATAGLMMKYRMAWFVFAGSISAQAVLNVIYVFAGRQIGERVPAGKIRWIAGILFLIFGVLMIFKQM